MNDDHLTFYFNYYIVVYITSSWFLWVVLIIILCSPRPQVVRIPTYLFIITFLSFFCSYDITIRFSKYAHMIIISGSTRMYVLYFRACVHVIVRVYFDVQSEHWYESWWQKSRDVYRLLKWNWHICYGHIGHQENVCYKPYYLS